MNFSQKDLAPENLINSREAFRPQIRPKLKPVIDKQLSKITGVTVLANDPRLLDIIVKFKRNNELKRKQSGVDFQDDLMNNPEFIEEVKRIYSTHV